MATDTPNNSGSLPTRINEDRGLPSSDPVLPPTSYDFSKLKTPTPPEHSQRYPAIDPTELALPLAPSMHPQDLRLDPLLTTLVKSPMGKHEVPFISGIPLLSRIGRGGMGAVYYGMHLRLGIEVAVKILPFHLAELNPDSIKRFGQEAKLSARIQSDHLVRVLDVNEENGLYYLVMEFVYGESAGNYLKKIKASGARGLPEKDAIEVMRAVGHGLNAAHRAGVVHRDIKPDNILLPWRNDGTPEFGRAKLADLGLSRVESEDRGITVTQMAMGTPGFMAPEQADDAKRAGKSADVYSMAASLYNLIAGHPPFHGKPMIQIILDTQQKPHESLRILIPETSLALSTTLDCCLAKNPLERLPDGEKWNEALGNCLDRPFEPPMVVAHYSKSSKGHFDETFKPNPKMLSDLKMSAEAPVQGIAPARKTDPKSPVVPPGSPVPVYKPLSGHLGTIKSEEVSAGSYALEKAPDIDYTSAPKREEPKPKAVGYLFMCMILLVACSAVGVKLFWPKPELPLKTTFNIPAEPRDKSPSSVVDKTPLPSVDANTPGISAPAGTSNYDLEVREGEQALASGKYKDAVDSFLRAIQLNATGPAARKGITTARVGLKIQAGQAFIQTHEWSKAQQAFTDALALDPNSESAKAGLEKAKAQSE